MAIYGYGLDDDWTMVLEVCLQEIVGLKGSCLMLEQQHHNKLIHTETKGSCLKLTQKHHNNHTNKTFTGSCLMPTHRRHNKHNTQLTPNSCMSHAPMYLQDYLKVTLLGGPLSHTHLHRGNCVPKLHNGFCQSLVQQHHNRDD